MNTFLKRILHAKTALGKKIMLAVVAVFLITSTVYMLLGRPQGQAETNTDPLNKLVSYQYDSNSWVTYAVADTSIDAFAVNGNGYLLYKTADGRLFGRLKANTTTPDPVIQVVNYPGFTAQIVDISAGFGITFALESNGRVFYTRDNAATWEVRTQIPFVSNNNAKVIGVDGQGTEIAIYGDGFIAAHTPATGWLDLGRRYDFNTYGFVNSGDVGNATSYYTTDKGYVLYTQDNQNYIAYNKFAYGNHIYPSVWFLGNSLAVAYPLDAAKKYNIFTQFQGIAGAFQDQVYLRAVIPGCRVGKMAQYTFGSSVGFMTNISDKCDPNAPGDTTPEQPGQPAQVNNTYNVNYQGVSVHVTGETLNTDGSVSAGIANVTRGGRARYTMTVNNPDLAAKAVDLVFDIPPGFGLVALPAGATQNGQRLTWNSYPLPAGQSSTQITIDVQAP